MKARALPYLLLDVRATVLLLLALMALSCSGPPTPTSTQAPATLDSALTQLIDSFEEDAGQARAFSSNLSVQPSLQAALELNRESIAALLAPARTSQAYANDLAETLLSPLHAYAERFRPGSTIDEGVLGNTTYEMGEQPDYGLSLRAYLLLELVKQQQSAALAREAFATLDKVVRASSYLTVESQLYRHREDTDVAIAAELARERERYGGENPSSLGMEIAWHCESFLAGLPKEDPFLPSAATARVEAYRQWRTETMAADGESEWLGDQHTFATINCVRDLVTLLP